MDLDIKLGNVPSFVVSSLNNFNAKLLCGSIDTLATIAKKQSDGYTTTKYAKLGPLEPTPRAPSVSTSPSKRAGAAKVKEAAETTPDAAPTVAAPPSEHPDASAAAAKGPGRSVTAREPEDMSRGRIQLPATQHQHQTWFHVLAICFICISLYATLGGGDAKVAFWKVLSALQAIFN